MEKKNKFKQYIIEHKKQILGAVLAFVVFVAYLLVLSVNVSAMPYTDAYSEKVDSVLPYTVYFTNGDSLSSSSFVSGTADGNYTIELENSYDVTQFSLTNHERPIVTTNLDLRDAVSGYSVLYEDGIISIYDLQYGLGEATPIGSYTCRYSFNVTIPNGENNTFTRSVIGSFNYSDANLTTLGMQVRNKINNIFEASTSQYTLNENSLIYITDLQANYSDMIMRMRITDPDEITTETISSIEKVGKILGEDGFGVGAGALSGYMFGFTDNLATFDLANYQYIDQMPGLTDVHYKYVSGNGNVVGYGNDVQTYRFYEPTNTYTEGRMVAILNGSSGNEVSIFRIDGTRIWANGSYFVFGDGNYYNGNPTSTIGLAFASAFQGYLDEYTRYLGEWYCCYKDVSATTEITMTNNGRIGEYYTIDNVEEFFESFGGYHVETYTIWQGTASMFRDVVGGFFSFAPFGNGITIGSIFLFIIGIALLVWVIKIFFGG